MTAFLPVRRPRAPARPPTPTRLATRQVGLGRALAAAFGLLLVSAALGLSLGAAGLPLGTVWRCVVAHIPLVPHPHVAEVDNAIVWQIRAPRVVGFLGKGRGSNMSSKRVVAAVFRQQFA